MIKYIEVGCQVLDKIWDRINASEMKNISYLIVNHVWYAMDDNRNIIEELSLKIDRQLIQQILETKMEY